MAYLRQSKRWDLSFHGVRQFFGDFTENSEQWTLKSKKKLELELNEKKKKKKLLLSDGFQQNLNELDKIAVVVLSYDEMRLL